MRSQHKKYEKKLLAVLMASAMGTGLLSSGVVYEAADASVIKVSNKQGSEENEVYGYGTMTMSYAEYYSGDVTNAQIDAVSSATVTKNMTFPNADSTEPTDDGYKINGVKNVPVKVMASASDELKSRVTLNAEGAAEPTQYKVVDENGIGATVYNVKDTVKDASATLITNSVWGDYEIDIIEKSTSYLRNTRSDIKDEATGEIFEINSQIQGIIVETTKGYKVGTAHMENIWVQPYEIAFSVDGNANSNEFKKLVGETVSKVTFIMPSETYIYELSEGVYIKPVYQNKISGKFSSDGMTFTLDEEVSGLTNAKIAVSYREGRQTVSLLDAAAVSGKEYTLTAAVPDATFVSVVISCDEYADITVDYPMMSWQKAQLEEMVSSAAGILSKLEDSMLNEHKNEAEELISNTGATAAEANELIGELTSLLDSANANLAKVLGEKLSETIDIAKNLVETDYTESSWAALSSALAAAEAQLSAEGTQTEIEEAYESLLQAVNGLVKNTGSGNDSQTDDKSTTIENNKVTISSLAGKKKQITVKWKKMTGAEGYQIQYALNKKFSNAQVTSVKDVSKAVIKKLETGKKYYVRIRAYKKVDGKKVYSKYSAVKSIKLS